jgi:hypothetical protein
MVPHSLDYRGGLFIKQLEPKLDALQDGDPRGAGAERVADMELSKVILMSHARLTH